MISLRVATLHDLDALTAIEAASFPPAEGASRESFEARLKAFPEGFLIAEADGTPVGLIDGMVTNCETIEDRLYEDARLYDPQGAWQSVFGLAVHPDWRRRGIASDLLAAFIEKARREGRRGVMLTCKERLIPFYERFGFEKRGVSESVHGGAVWYDMTLRFEKKEKRASETSAPKRRRAPQRSVMRTRYIRFGDAEELGALIRTRRARLGMTLGDAAICCGVGRRFLLDLESGKPTAQFAKVLQVLDTFGMGLALTGTGASFTEEDLRETTVERGEVVWEAEFEKGLPDLPGEETGDGIRRGRPIGAKKISPVACKVKVVDLKREERARRKAERDAKVEIDEGERKK